MQEIVFNTHLNLLRAAESNNEAIELLFGRTAMQILNIDQAIQLLLLCEETHNPKWRYRGVCCITISKRIVEYFENSNNQVSKKVIAEQLNFNGEPFEKMIAEIKSILSEYEKDLACSDNFEYYASMSEKLYNARLILHSVNNK